VSPFQRAPHCVGSQGGVLRKPKSAAIDFLNRRHDHSLAIDNLRGRVRIEV
jgi:hypothetical protein